MLRALILAALIAPSPAIAQIAAPAPTVTLRLDQLDRLIRAEIDAAMADDWATRAKKSKDNAADATNVIVTATSGSFTAGALRLAVVYRSFSLPTA
jgi:hypothetical protein